MNNSKKILCVIILLIVIFIIYKYIYKFRERKIICCYTNTSYFGLGDYIRGIVYSLQNKSKKEHVYINYKDHEISKFLENTYGNEYGFVPNDEKIIKTNENNYSSNITNYENFLYNNSMCNYPINQNIREAIKKMFSMKPEFKMIYLNKLSEINLGEYFSILHIRVNDDEVNKSVTEISLEKLVKYIDKNLINRNILVLSNNYDVKKYIAEKYRYKYYDIKPAHTGLVNEINTTDFKENVKDTLIEFFTISNAFKIYQFCTDNDQISGFSKRISEIYDIPIVLIHKEH